MGRTIGLICVSCLGSPVLGADDAPSGAQRVLLIGDSSIQFHLGTQLKRRLEHFGAEVRRVGRLGSGLTSSEHDWPEEVKKLKERWKPDVILAHLGVNDGRRLELEDGTEVRFNEPVWREEYRRLVVELIATMQEGGTTAVLVGMPMPRGERLARRLEAIDRILVEAAADRGAIFLPLWKLSADDNGAYSDLLEHRGTSCVARTPDGIHFTRDGARHVARRLVNRLQRQMDALETQQEVVRASPNVRVQ